MKKETKHYGNGDFNRDLKKAYKSSGKKKKDSSYGLSRTGGAYVRNYNGFGKQGAGPTIAAGMANGKADFEPNSSGGQYIMKKGAKKKMGKKKKTAMPMVGKAIKSMPRMQPKMQAGGTTQKLMDSAMNKSKVLGAPALPKGAPVPDAMNAQNPQWANMAKKSKKSKKKSSKKEKVSHVLQETSMCKECKTSHPKGKHMKASGVKKKR